MQELNQILLETPPVWKGSSKLFRKLQERGIFEIVMTLDSVISYTEYLFLLCILTKPHAGFRIAFNMFDTDGNEMVDKKEFLVGPVQQSCSEASLLAIVIELGVTTLICVVALIYKHFNALEQLQMIQFTFLQLQDIFRKKNEKKEKKGNEEKRAMVVGIHKRYLSQNCGVLYLHFYV
ncbi:hypothetical protein JD844_027098 [Phrynosoma platyrhinos]|uniref:EF-hand domain-containing protein n=1 Tax=Phrynosoma platyrhinos TaxID=52577 RepID=A0ABQ7SFR9_PHRPL|nr:hypothetical protein JD844_027098 [Phrynosoma platyrhinos]